VPSTRVLKTLFNVSSFFLHDFFVSFGATNHGLPCLKPISDKNEQVGRPVRGSAKHDIMFSGIENRTEQGRGMSEVRSHHQD